MAKARKKSPAVPLTVSRAALLVDGSDIELRTLVYDLVAYSHRLHACREAFASIAGVTPVQYEILMIAGRGAGLPVGEVATRLHRSGAFITIEASKLVERGILAKAADPADGRRVLLQVTAAGLSLVRRLAPYQVRVNDELFGQLDARRFRELRSVVRQLLAAGNRAVALLELMMREQEAA
jgi:MarR family transcriptional regulator, organic hydroperoxide resistance regulator